MLVARHDFLKPQTTYTVYFIRCIYSIGQNNLCKSSLEKVKLSSVFLKVTVNRWLPRALPHVKRTIVTTCNKINKKTNAHVIKLK